MCKIRHTSCGYDDKAKTNKNYNLRYRVTAPVFFPVYIDERKQHIKFQYMLTYYLRTIRFYMKNYYNFVKNQQTQVPNKHIEN